MAFRTVLLVTLMSLVSWISGNARTVKDILDMEAKLSVGYDSLGEQPTSPREYNYLKQKNDPSEWDPRIIGGQPAEEGQYPWMVSFHYNGRFICSSFLVTNDTLMTAAHCVNLNGDDPEPPDSFTGYVGTVNRDGPEIRIEFSEVISHEQYGSSTEYDIALLKLKAPVTISDSVRPICLPSKGANFDDTMAQAMGWGVYNRGNRESSPVLLSVTEHVPKNANCRFVYGMMGIPITRRHVCAGGGDTGVCFGDSGGPLVHLNATRPLAIGVASFVSFLGCAVNGVPAVYTSTNSYLDWIQENMGDSASDLCIM